MEIPSFQEAMGLFPLNHQEMKNKVFMAFHYIFAKGVSCGGCGSDHLLSCTGVPKLFNARTPQVALASGWRPLLQDAFKNLIILTAKKNRRYLGTQP